MNDTDREQILSDLRGRQETVLDARKRGEDYRNVDEADVVDIADEYGVILTDDEATLLLDAVLVDPSNLSRLRLLRGAAEQERERIARLEERRAEIDARIAEHQDRITYAERVISELDARG